MIDWNKFADEIKSRQRFVLTTHIRPDGDAIGSTVAFAEILERLGKEVLLCGGFALPNSLRSLDVKGRFKQIGVSATIEELNAYDALIVLDTSAWAQLGPMSDAVRAFPGKKMVLDHHVSSDDLGAESFKNTEAEATGRIVVDAADALGVALDLSIAVPAFCAVATDTGWFRFSSATADTYRLVARLIEAGAKPDELYKELYENDTLGRLKLIGRALANATPDLEGRLIYTFLELSDFEAAGALPSESEDIINMLLAVNGTQFAVILVEQKTGGFKISLRSRCDVNCAKLAEVFGGGGHKKAAGLFIADPLPTAMQKILDVVRAAM